MRHPQPVLSSLLWARSQSLDCSQRLEPCSRACRDAESKPYMSSQAPASQLQGLQQRLGKELKQRWWLWSALLFTVLLLGSLFVFRSSLYDSASHGLPLLAGKLLCRLSNQTLKLAGPRSALLAVPEPCMS